MLCGIIDAVKLGKLFRAQGIHFGQSVCFALVETCHERRIFGTLLVKVGLILQTPGGTVGQFFQNTLLELGETAIVHLEI